MSRYRSDSAFRQRARVKARQRYRSLVGMTVKAPLRDVESRRKFGNVRNLSLNGVLVGKSLSYTSSELCAVLGGFTLVTLLKWQRDGRFPCAVYTCPDERKDRVLFSDEQVRRMLPLLEAHFKLRNQIRHTDTKLIDALFACMATQQIQA